MRHYPSFHVDDDDRFEVRGYNGGVPVMRVGMFNLHFDNHDQFKRLYDAMREYLVEKEGKNDKD